MKIRMTYAALLGLAACGGVSEPPVATLPSSYDQVALAEIEAVNPDALRYINRLSDLLFVAARIANDNGAGDVLWVPGQNR